MAAPEKAHDWLSIEQSEEFTGLVRRRRRFVAPATVFFLTWYLAFIVVAGVAPEFMGESVYEGLTIGYVFALSQFLMVAVLGIWYLRYSDRELDPLREQIRAEEAAPAAPVHAARPNPRSRSRRAAARRTGSSA